MQFKALTISSLALLSSAVAAPLQSRAAGWSITGFTRNCTDPNWCTYYFTINTGVATQYCIVEDKTTGAADPATTHAFYGVPCEQVTLNPKML